MGKISLSWDKHQDHYGSLKYGFNQLPWKILAALTLMNGNRKNKYWWKICRRANMWKCWKIICVGFNLFAWRESSSARLREGSLHTSLGVSVGIALSSSDSSETAAVLGRSWCVAPPPRTGKAAVGFCSLFWSVKALGPGGSSGRVVLLITSLRCWRVEFSPAVCLLARCTLLRLIEATRLETSTPDNVGISLTNS